MSIGCSGIKDTAPFCSERLQSKAIHGCTPGRKQCKKTMKYDTRHYKRGNRIEIMFGRIKAWRRVATKYDRCPTAFFSIVALAAAVIYWL